MAIFVSNLSKNDEYLLKRAVKNIFIQTRENIMHWGGNDTKIQYSWKDAGFAEEGEVLVKCKPTVFKNIDKSTLQTGFDCEFSITLAQYYSLYDFEKFMNKECIINLNGIQTYIKDVYVTIELDGKIGDGKGVVKISGTKYVDKIRDFVDGNPFGTLPAPWPQVTGNFPDYRPEGVMGPLGYEYILSPYSEEISYITPSAPSAETEITSLRLTLLDGDHNKISVPVTITSVKHFIGSIWTIIDAADYDVEYEGNGNTLLISGTHTYSFGDKVLVTFSY